MDFLSHLFRPRTHAEKRGKDEIEIPAPIAEGPEELPDLPPPSSPAVTPRWRLDRDALAVPARPAPGPETLEPRAGDITLALEDVLPRVPTHALKPGLHDPERPLLFRASDFGTSLAGGKPVIALSVLAERYPDVFEVPALPETDTEVPLPPEKVLQQTLRLAEAEPLPPVLPAPLPAPPTVEFTMSPEPATMPELAVAAEQPRADMPTIAGADVPPAFPPPTRFFPAPPQIRPPTIHGPLGTGAVTHLHSETVAPVAIPPPAFTQAPAVEEPAMEEEAEAIESQAPVEPAPAAEAPASPESEPSRITPVPVPEPPVSALEAPPDDFELQQEPLQAIFMTDEELSLARISELSASLPGITGCMILIGDHLTQGGEKPAGLNAATLRALSSQLATTVEGFRDQLPAEPNFTLYGGNRALSLFARTGLCLCVVHAPRGFLPGVRERLSAVADSLLHGLPAPAGE